MKKHIIIGILSIVIITTLTISLYLDSIIKSAISKYGSEIIGTSVKVSEFSLKPIDGYIKIKGLTIANPKNYQSPYLFDLSSVSAKIDIKSLFSDLIIVEEIKIEKPIITYEVLSLNQNNIKQIQEHLAKDSKDTIKQTTNTNNTTSTAPKVIIKKLSISQAELQAVVSLNNKPTKTSIKVPEITLTNIGEEKNGKIEDIMTSIPKVINKILNTMTQAVIDNNLNDIKDLAKQNLNNAVDTAKNKIKSLGIFKN